MSTTTWPCAHKDNESLECGTCEARWCGTCDPSPANQCHYCTGRGYSTHEIAAPYEIEPGDYDDPSATTDVGNDPTIYLAAAHLALLRYALATTLDRDPMGDLEMYRALTRVPDSPDERSVMRTLLNAGISYTQPQGTKGYWDDHAYTLLVHHFGYGKD